LFNLREELSKWHRHRSIRRVSITMGQPLTTTLPRIITIRRPIITISASTKRRRSTPLRLTNIASSPTNILRLPTIILKNDDGTRKVFSVVRLRLEKKLWIDDHS
jgi:hypothetical protein